MLGELIVCGPNVWAPLSHFASEMSNCEISSSAKWQPETWRQPDISNTGCTKGAGYRAITIGKMLTATISQKIYKLFN